MTFQPKTGKAILWPSVLAGDPHSKDSRTDHEALPVTAGEKFGANFWIHQVRVRVSVRVRVRVSVRVRARARARARGALTLSVSGTHT